MAISRYPARRRGLVALATTSSRPPCRHTADRDATIDADPTAALIRIVRAQLDHLPARQRELFDLVDLQGYAPADAAALLGIEPSTARVHVLRARRAIRGRILAVHPDVLAELN